MVGDGSIVHVLGVRSTVQGPGGGVGQQFTVQGGSILNSYPCEQNHTHE